MSSTMWKRSPSGRLIRFEALPEISAVLTAASVVSDDILTGFSIKYPHCFDEIMSYLKVVEMLGTLATSIKVKSVRIPIALGAVNFYQFKKPISYWKLLCHHQTFLRELYIEVGFRECEIVESLLLRCKTNFLQSVKIWIGGSLCMAESGVCDLTNDLNVENVIIDPSQVSRYLIEKDTTYSPDHSIESNSKDILSLLAEKCSRSLKSLRISFVFLQWRSKISPLTLMSFINLQQLEICMGEPLKVLHAISLLSDLKRFTWGSTRYGLDYNIDESDKYVLISSSLQIVNLLSIGKSFYFFDFKCPLLTELHFHNHAYGSGFIYGRNVFGQFWQEGTAGTTYIGGKIVCTNKLFMLIKCNKSGNWLQRSIVENPNLVENIFYGIHFKRDLNDELEAFLRKLNLPENCQVVSD